MRMYACGVPKDKCSGKNIQGSHGMPTTGPAAVVKAHMTSVEAFNCKAKNLEENGYTRIGSREFSRGDEPILLLDKKSKFGGLLKRGKNEKGAGNRFMPLKRTGGMII